jgi:prevent-host-death family protein
MRRVPATEFKAKCLELMDRVAESRETYLITKRGKPVARLVPVEWKAKEPLFGRLRGMVVEIGDIMSPVVPAAAWDTLKEWDELNAPGPATTRRRPKRARRKRAPTT